MEKGVLNFWNLERDPFQVAPLNPHQSLDRSILVATKTIKRIRGESEAIENSRTSLSYIIRGGRGTGKSTAIYDLYHRLSQEANSTGNLPINCNVYPDQDFVETTENIIQDIHVSLLMSLDRLLQSEHYPYKHHLDELKDIIRDGLLNTDKRVFVDRAIFAVFEILMRNFNRIIVFVDNLDKIHPKDYYRIAESLSRDQMFIEFLMKGEILPEGKSCTFVFAINNFIASLIEREISYLGDTAIEIEPWSNDEMIELIDKRLQSVSRDRPYNLLNYFERDALKEIFIANDYNPRYCQNACKKLMEESYMVYVNTEAREVNKPIKKHFCCSKPAVMDGTKGFLASTKFEILDLRLRKHHRGAYMDLQRCLNESKDRAPEVIRILIDIFRGKNEQDPGKVPETPIRRSLIKTRKRGNTILYYLMPRIYDLIQYVDELLDSNDEVMQHFLFSLTI